MTQVTREVLRIVRFGGCMGQDSKMHLWNYKKPISRERDVTKGTFLQGSTQICHQGTFLQGSTNIRRQSILISRFSGPLQIEGNENNDDNHETFVW